LGGGLNTYAYVSASPLSYIDPDGLVKVDLFGLKDSPIFHQRISEYLDKSDECLVYAHGYPTGVIDGRGTTPVHLNAEQLANVLKAAGCKANMKVTLYSCRTGLGDNSIAEGLAKYFKSVTAPNRQVWYNKVPGGTGPNWIYGKNADKSMNISDPGTMKTFP
jgi:hypothetical protein